MADPLPRQRSADGADVEALFRLTAPLVRRYAVHQVGADLADDVVSDTFAVVWRRREELPGAVDEQRAWVFGVAHLTVKAVARRRRRGLTVVRAEAHEARRVVADHADLVAGEDLVDRLLAALPPREREAMELTVWVGLSPAQTARALGCTVSAVSTRLTRARKRLGPLLGANALTDGEVGRVR